jgi:hypothetical protein
LIVTVDPGLQLGPFNVLTGPINAGLKGAVTIAPAVATAPPATAPAVPAAAATGPAGFALFFFAANAGETDIAATTTQQAMVFTFIGVPSVGQLPTALPANSSIGYFCD